MTIAQSLEFIYKPKVTAPCFPMLPEIDFGIPWGYFDGASQGHRLDAGWGWFSTLATIITFSLDMLQNKVQITYYSS